MKIRFRERKWRVFSAAVCTGLAATVCAATAQAQVTQSFSQQGRLLSAGGFPVPNGVHKFTIQFYNVQTGGTPLWTYIDNNVPVANGVFTVPILVDAAGMAQFVAAAPSWVGISLDTDSELPRIALRQVPFALVAQQALALTCSGCVTGAHIADGSIGNVDLSASAQFGSIQPGAGATGTAFSVTNGSNVLKFAAGANATVAVDNVNHVVTIGAAPQGSVSSITAGAGLSGGTITTSGTIAIANGGVSNAMIQTPNVTVAPGLGLSGGGTIALGGSATLNNTGTLSVLAAPPLAVTGGQNPTVSISTALAGLTTAQVLKWSGTAWNNAFLDASELTGVLAVAKGGTGLSSPGAAGNFLRSNGATWASSPLSASDLPSLAANYVDLVSTQTAGGAKTWSALGTFAAGIALNNATSNKITFAGGGVAAPTTTTTSAGTKVVYFPSVSAALVDYAMGVEAGSPSALWYSVPAASASYAHKWYGGTTQIMQLKGDGALSVGGAVSAPSFIGAFSGNGSALTALNPSAVSAGTMTGVNTTGNAATVTNGVYTTGSYANPNWLTSLLGSKITGNIPGNAVGFTGTLGGDVNGTQATTSVVALQGRPVLNTAPATNQALVFNGTQWAPALISGSNVTGVANGVGTTNRVTKWTNTTGGIVDSSLFDNGNIGLGNTSPGAPLTISHEASYAFPNPGSGAKGAINIRMTNSLRQSGLTFSQAGADNAMAGLYVHQDNSAGTHMYLATTDSYAAGPQTRLSILNNGSVGLGTSTPYTNAALEIVQNPAKALNLRTNYLDFHGDNGASTDRPYFRGTASHNVFALGTGVGGAMYLNYPGDLQAGITTSTRIQESLFISASGSGGGGNVGIKTASPQVALHVAGSVRGGGGGGSLRVDTGSGFVDLGAQNSSWTHMYADTTARPFIFNTSVWSIPGMFSSYAAADLQLGTNGSARVTVLASNGSVGVGTTAPAYALHVNGDAAVEANKQLIARYTTNESYKASMGWNSLQLGNNGDNYIIGGRTNGGGNLVFVTNNTSDYRYGSTGLNGTTVMTLTAGGNVGIGTSSPGYKLDVAGDIHSSTNISADGTACWGTSGGGMARSRTETLNDASTGAVRSGFYETSSPTNFYPGDSTWTHLIHASHSNSYTGNNYSLQIAGGFWDQQLWFRAMGNVQNRPWKRIDGHAVYTRWGVESCPATATTLYWGWVAGPHYQHSGSGANQVCLHSSPSYDQYNDGNQNGGLLYGTEYEDLGAVAAFSGHQNYKAHCAVCQSNSQSVFVQWGRNICPTGYTTEYQGYAMSTHYTQQKSEFICVDRAKGAYTNNGDYNGNLWYTVETELGALNGSGYVQDREVTCAVCSL